MLDIWFSWVRRKLDGHTWRIERVPGLLLMFLGVFIVLK